MNCRSELGGQKFDRFPAFFVLLVQLIALLIWTVRQPADLRAQVGMAPATGTPGVAGEMRTVAGRVLSGSSDSLRPVASQMVVLHRISADSSGPVDSALTSTAGTYRFRYRLAGPRSMYIVSSRYAGIAYFSTPLRDATVTSPEADITVYDTTSATFPLAVRGRHMVIAPPEGGVRRVVDVFEVANDSNRTRIAGSDGMTWRVALPREARDYGSSGGDLPAEAFRFAGGNAELLVAFPPGSRQVVLTYAIPASGAIEVPVIDATNNLEVLVEGTGGRVSGAGLTAEDAVTMEGRTFQRYTASPVRAGSSFSIGGSGGGNARRVALLAIAAVAVALGFLVARRSPARVPAGTAQGADALARQIAALDHVYTVAGKQDGAGGEYYRSRRTVLLERLVEELKS